MESSTKTCIWSVLKESCNLSLTMCPICAAKYSHSGKKYGVTIQTSSMEMQPRGSYRTHRGCCRHTQNRRNIRIVYPSIKYVVFSKYSLKFQVRFPSMHPERAWSSQRHNASWWYCPALPGYPWTRAWDLIILEARCNQAQTLPVIKQLGRPPWSGCGSTEGPVPYLGTSLLFNSTSWYLFLISRQPYCHPVTLNGHICPEKLLFVYFKNPLCFPFGFHLQLRRGKLPVVLCELILA